MELSLETQQETTLPCAPPPHPRPLTEQQSNLDTLVLFPSARTGLESFKCSLVNHFDIHLYT